MTGDHYFSRSPAAASEPGEVLLRLPDFETRLLSDRGVFSAGSVDAGTVELLRAIPPPPAKGDLLDLGCGYGPIACTLARRAPRATVWAVDVNERALELTARNAERLGLERVHAVRPEEVPPGTRFEGIWSNPPVRIGKAAMHDLLAGWLGRLAPGASAWLVVLRHLGADSLAAWLGAAGWEVTRSGSRKGYRILRVATK